jgi:hypothetical protein
MMEIKEVFLTGMPKFFSMRCLIREGRKPMNPLAFGFAVAFSFAVQTLQWRLIRFAL